MTEESYLDNGENGEVESRTTPKPQSPEDFLTREQIDSIIEEQATLTPFGKADDFVQREGKSYFGIFDLPSGGIMYQGRLLKTVKIKQITGKVDQILDSRTDGVAGHVVLDELMMECVEAIGDVTEKHLIRKIITGPILIMDYIFLMFKIRQISLGDFFRFSLVCSNPECKHKGKYKVDIGDMEMITMNYSDDYYSLFQSEVKNFSEVWKFSFRFGTQADAKHMLVINKKLQQEKKEAQERLERIKGKGIKIKDVSKGQDDELSAVTASLIAKLDSVIEPPETEDGEPKHVYFGRKHTSYKDEKGNIRLSALDSVEYIDNMPHKVRLQMYMIIAKLEPAFDLDVYVNCPKCGNSMEFTIHPQDPAFFYPSEIGT